MPLPEIHGIIPILVTPFHDGGAIDEESLRRLVDFVIDSGVHAIGIALGSEVFKFTEAERELVITSVIRQVKDRVPVIVNTGAPATDLAVLYSRQAQNWGARAVMCTPPGAGFSAAELIDYFQAISDAVDVPVIIQDTNATPVSAGLIRTICEQAEHVSYCKVESSPQPTRVYEAVQAGGEHVSIIGGAAGQFFIEELRRGSIGTMPWPSLPGPFVKVWDLWQSGDRAGAKDAFERTIAPLLRVPAFTLSGGHRVHKEVLRRQGIIKTSYVRRPAEALDPITLEELDEACTALGIG
jgi:4-hydroxy-tetrahydrodipicolinate synthase